MAKKEANSFVLTIAGIAAATVIGVVGVKLTPAPHVIFSLAPSAEPQATAEPDPISCVLAGTGQVVDFADVVFLAVKPQQCHHLIVQMQLRQWRVDLLPVLCPAQQIIDGNPIEVCQRDKVAMIDFLKILFFITSKS